VHAVASGLDCLAQLQATPAEARPHALLMDLAMPGIDGWETVRRLRAQALSDAPVAIVSANAFDKGLDNDVGIAPEDFIVKPVRVHELLDWLGQRLGLEWIEAARPPAPAPEPAPTMVVPTPDVLKALAELVDSGYVRGIHRMLDRLAEERPECEAFVTHLRTLARQFQLDAMAGFLRKQQEAAAGRPPEREAPLPSET
jgi:CheY-like chemotaxis protein